MAKRVTKTTVFFTALIILIFVAIFGWNIFKDMMIKKFMASFSFPAATVTVTKAKQENWQPFIESTGSLSAVDGVNISPQASGNIVKIAAQSGAMLKKGDLIIALDTSVEQAELKNAEAAQRLAVINYDRDMKLFKRGAVPASTIDTDKATLEEKAALAEQYRAQIQLKQIRAPFDGKLGINPVNLGEYMNAGTSFTNLQNLSPLYVNYTIPQQDISQIYVGQKVALTSKTYGNKAYTGTITAIDTQVNNDTRSMQVRATIQNTDQKHLLYPGMFVTVHTLLPLQNEVISVPQGAINYTLYGDTVYLVGKAKDPKTGKEQTIAKQIYVTTGMEQNDSVEITKGLKPGDEIITQGQVKLRNGSPIIIQKKISDTVTQTSHNQHPQKTHSKVS